MIYHIADNTHWVGFQNEAYYLPDGFEKEGFVHCCSLAQITGVLARYFNGKTNLVVLHIYENLLNAEIKYEAGPTGETFPHVYGKIDKQAIVKVEMCK